MKKWILPFAIIFLLLLPQAISEELPEDFYELEAVKTATQEQIKQFRQFTRAQVEVIYLASKALHEEYFGVELPAYKKIKDMRIPQGEYIIGDLIPAGNYRFSLINAERDVVTLWVEKANRISSNYYSMTSEKPEVILHLEDDWTLRVTYADAIMSEISEL